MTLRKLITFVVTIVTIIHSCQIGYAKTFLDKIRDFSKEICIKMHLCSKEQKIQVFIRLLQHEIRFRTKFKDAPNILYPYGKVLDFIDDDILIISLDDKIIIHKILINRKSNCVVLSNNKRSYIILKTCLVNDDENFFEIFYSKVIPGIKIAKVEKIDSTFEIEKTEMNEHTSQLKHLRELKTDPKDKILITLSTLIALKEEQGEVFEFEYDLEKFSYLTKQIIQYENF